jgi:hypothetical protein
MYSSQRQTQVEQFETIEEYEAKQRARDNWFKKELHKYDKLIWVSGAIVIILTISLAIVLLLIIKSGGLS